MLSMSSTATLNNGVEIPLLGLGVYQARKGREARDAVGFALEAGYRHIDTASIYTNEGDVGEAVRISGLPRESIFITTKLWRDDFAYDAAIRAFNNSLGLLQMPYVDLYLLHWPVVGLRREAWRAAETLYDEGRIRAIGVSNYMVRHLEEMEAYARIAPAVNQIELSPYNYQHRRDTLDYCRANNIVVEAYSPLTKARKLKDPRLVSIASKYGKTPAQVLIRWGLQKGFVSLPKSSKQNRIIENADVFDFTISAADMDTLDSFNEALATGWDPTDAP